MDWKGLLWKAYFILFTLAVLFVYLVAPLFKWVEFPTISDLVEIVIYLPALVSLFLFAFRISFLSAELWKMYFAAFITWGAVSLLWLANDTGLAVMWENILILLAAALLIWPLFLASYLYAFSFLHEPLKRKKRR